MRNNTGGITQNITANGEKLKVNGNDKLLKGLYKICAYFVFGCVIVFGAFFVLRSGYRAAVYPLKYKEEVFEYADGYGLSRALVFAVIRTESGFNPNAVSSAGAKGLMQIKDETGKYIAERLGRAEYDLYDAETNVEFGCYYIKYLSLRFKDEKTALAAYNAGEGNVALWLMNEAYSDDGKTLKSVPFPETERYLEKIYKSFEKYRKLYGKVLDKQKNFG